MNKAAAEGDVVRAAALFKELQLVTPDKKQTLLWNTMLKAHANAGDTDKASILYQDMMRNQVRVNGRTFGKLVKAAARRGNAEEAEMWLARLSDAPELAVDAIACSAVIDAHAKASQPEKAMVCLEHMASFRLRPDEVAYNAVIDAHAKSSNAPEAVRWLHRMAATCLEPATFAYTAVINSWARQRDTANVTLWLNKMIAARLTPTDVSYTAVMDSCGQAVSASGNDRLPGAGPVEPARDVVAYTSQVSRCAKRGDVAGALQVFEEMMRARVMPNVITYNAMINAHARSGDAAGASEWLARITGAGLLPDVISYSSVMKCCAKHGETATVIWWLNEMIRRGLTPDAVAYNAVIHSCAKKGRTSDAAGWLTRMTMMCLKADEVTYTTVINSCAKGGEAGEAVKWLMCMAQSALQPNVVSFTAAFKACAKAGDADRARDLFSMMKHRDVRPNVMTWTSLIEACGKAMPSRPQEAEAYFQEMLESGIWPDRVALLTLMIFVSSSKIRVLGQARWAPLCAKLCEEWPRLRTLVHEFELNVSIVTVSHDNQHIETHNTNIS